VYASKGSALKEGKTCLGNSTADPADATFNQIYSGKYFYVIWTDLFYNDPDLCSGKTACPSEWAHAKGMLAWNADGEGFVMQVSTPNWPGAGDKEYERENGNTLGCERRGLWAGNKSARLARTPAVASSSCSMTR
jgi:hypothetical protein